MSGRRFPLAHDVQLATFIGCPVHVHKSSCLLQKLKLWRISSHFWTLVSAKFKHNAHCCLEKQLPLTFKWKLAEYFFQIFCFPRCKGSRDYSFRFENFNQVITNTGFICWTYVLFVYGKRGLCMHFNLD